MMVLFSLIGMSDPIRNNYDGPMLHIVRHLKPKTVYLFYTDAVKKYDELDNRYERAIKSVDKSIEVVKLYTNIEEVFIHESFSNELKKAFYQVCEKYKDDKIIVNITSGTQQMTAVLNLLISLGKYKVEPYQVTTPEKRANRSTSVSDKYDILEEIENNFDALSTLDEIEIRLIKTDLLQYKNAMILNQVQSLTELHYDYVGALQLIKDSSIEVTTNLRAFLNHGKFRLNLVRDKASNYVQSLNLPTLKYIQDQELSLLIEYYQIIRLKCESNDFVEMILMLDPFTINLQEMILKRKLNVNYSNLLTSGKPKKLSADKIRKKYPNVYKKLNQEYRHGYEDAIPNSKVLNIMIHSLNYDDKIDTSTLLLLDELKKFKETRNDLAHELKSVAKNDIDAIIGRSLEALFEDVNRCIVKLFGVKEKELKVYQILNDYIRDEIQASI